ncbi:hypothetical protein AB9P05_01405 [Roseivirga sp. BDSF3-8]|uniref:hypothetical protein n=1 Tax=Roseivirga sp. BDSF3-8 TaxID=3241598 RepID=UPI003531A3C2
MIVDLEKEVSKKLLALGLAGTMHTHYVGKEQVYLLFGDKSAESITSINKKTGNVSWEISPLPGELATNVLSFCESDTALIVKSFNKLYFFDLQSGSLAGIEMTDEIPKEDYPPLKEWNQENLVWLPELWNRKSWSLYQADPDTIYIAGQIIKGGSDSNWQYEFKDLSIMEGRSYALGALTYADNVVLAQVIDPSHEGEIVYEERFNANEDHGFFIDDHHLAVYTEGEGIQITDIRTNEEVYRDQSPYAKKCVKLIMDKGRLIYITSEGQFTSMGLRELN